MLADADLPANTLTFTLENAPAFASVGVDGILRLSPLEADGPAVRPGFGRAGGPGAAQTRQIAPWTREGVESII